MKSLKSLPEREVHHIEVYSEKTNFSKAMKVTEELEEDEEDFSNNDEIAHLAKRISKVWIKRTKKSFATKKDKKGKAKLDEVICFECKEPEHIRSECPRLKKASKKKITKKKAMMATWKDLDEEQENAKSHEEEEIVANLCFMADIISVEETEVSNFELDATS